MSAAIFSIGTELTRGELVNTNAQWLAERLTATGFEVVSIDCCDDDETRVIRHLAALMAESDLVLCTGGLGPTTDDLTTAAVAKLLGVALVRDEPSFQAIAARLARFGRVISPTNAKQADFPAGSDILANRAGTAPGFMVRHGHSEAYFMPGVPREMKLMFEEQIIPRIQARAPRQQHQIKFSTFGEAEAAVGEKLSGIEAQFPGVIIGYRAHFPEIEVKVLARSNDAMAARSLAERAASVVRERLGNIIYSDGTLSFAGAVAQTLRERKLTIALAESCTGGLLGSMLTAEPASDYFLADVVSYANQAKTDFLGVAAELVAEHGAVSAPVAEAMARGIRARTGASLGVSITGIAGPSGGSEAKPVGLVFIGVASASRVQVKELRFGGDRRMIQTFAAYSALRLTQLAILSMA